GVGLLYEHSDPRKRLAPPITQLLDSRIDLGRRGRETRAERVSSFSFLRAALRLLHGCCRFLHGCPAIPPRPLTSNAPEHRPGKAGVFLIHRRSMLSARSRTSETPSAD